MNPLFEYIVSQSMRDKDLTITFVNIVEDLFRFDGTELKEIVNGYPQHCIIHMPELVIQLFLKGLKNKYGYVSFDYFSYSKENLFRGVQIVPGFENEIILFHKDYPIEKKEWMIKRISLIPYFVNYELNGSTELKYEFHGRGGGKSSRIK